MPTEVRGARDIVLRFIAGASTDSASHVPGELPVHAACERACVNLSRSLGASGFSALITRALVQAQGEHPILSEISLGRPPRPVLGDITRLASVHGAPAVTAGLEAILESMVGLLGRLIGMDVVARLLEHTPSVETHDGEDGQ